MKSRTIVPESQWICFCYNALLGVVFALALVPRSSEAQISKCIAADGKVTFTDALCPTGASTKKAAGFGALSKLGMAEEAECAASWFVEADKFVTALAPRAQGTFDSGSSAKSPKAISSNIDWSVCRGAGIDNPVNLDDLARNSSNTMLIFCKFRDPNRLRQLRQEQQLQKKASKVWAEVTSERVAEFCAQIPDLSFAGIKRLYQQKFAESHIRSSPPSAITPAPAPAAAPVSGTR